MLDDGLYLYGVWVADVDVVLNKQANDLTNPDTLQTDYSLMFTLPDTATIRQLLQNAEQLDAGGRDPYRLVPAKLIEEGEVTFNGSAALQNFQGGWKVSLAGPARKLFDQLGDLKLSDLDLSDYNHTWDLDTVANYAGATEGILYPLIDYGSTDNGVFAQDTITPALYASTLIKVMLRTCGYRAKGGWLNDELVKRIAIPFVGDSPANHDQEWIDARFSRVGVPDNPQPIILKSGHPIDIILPLTVDNDVLGNFQDGALDCYKADRATYVCKEGGRFSIQATVTFVYILRYGAPEVKLQLLRNGQKVAEAYWSEAGYKDQLDLPTVLSLDEKVLCRAGDELQIKLQGNARTNIASYALYFSQSQGEMYAAFSPDPSVYENDTWPVAANLPDITCADFLRSIALMCSGTFDIDDTAKTIELKTLNGVIEKVADAQDLSSYADESKEPENSVIIDGYGQRNLLKWKQQEKSVYKGYGDGVVSCDAQNIPLSIDLFEMPFSAVLNSQVNIPLYGNPLYIETRSVTGSGTSLQVTKKAAQPCLILVEPSKMVKVKVNAVTPDLTTVVREVQLMACWWSERPEPIRTGGNSFSLAFDRPAMGKGSEQTLIQRYFGGLKRILRRPRQLTISMYLNPSTLNGIDLYKPARLRGISIGSLDFADGFYYINKVENYQSGMPCSVILIAF